MNITITDRAASEVKRILAEQEFKPEDKAYLRLRVVGGGCSGFQHKLDLDDAVNEKLDDVFVFNGINVVVDKRSALYVEGATIDYVSDLNKIGFSVTNPSSRSVCGCGSSFSM